MKLRKVRIAYGEGSLEFSIGRNRLSGILENVSPARRDAGEILRKALSAGLCSKLSRILKNKRSILVVIPDLTRKAHLRDILPPILRLVERHCKIYIVAATGLHLPHSGEDLERLVGGKICNRYKVFSHRQDKASLANFGRTRDGRPIVLNRCLKECDCIISLGVIEPHLYAGFSGGAKTIAIGLAGEAVINATHHPAFLDEEKVELGRIRGNPFQVLLWEIAGKFPVVFSVNVVNDSQGNAVQAFAGGLRDVFQRGVKFARDIYEIEVRGSAEVVIAGIGYPKDVNLYQASRAMNYILDSSSPILEKGGFLVLAAELRDGLGRGIAEKRCFDALREAVAPAGKRECLEASLKRFVERVRLRGCLGGEHRAYMIARAMLKARIIFVGEKAAEVLKGLPFAAFKTIEESLSYIDKRLVDGYKIYVVPNALSVIARARRT